MEGPIAQFNAKDFRPMIEESEAVREAADKISHGLDQFENRLLDRKQQAMAKLQEAYEATNPEGSKKTGSIIPSQSDSKQCRQVTIVALAVSGIVYFIFRNLYDNLL